MNRWIAVIAVAVACVGAEPEAATRPQSWTVDPGVVGLGAAVEVRVDTNWPAFEVGETELDFGEDLVVTELEVLDAYRVLATVQVGVDSELGFRDVMVQVADQSDVLLDALQVVEASVAVEPNGARLGEMLEVALTGSATRWDDGYTWASFGDGVQVVSFDVLTQTTAVATLAVAPDARPGWHDVEVQDGPNVVTLYDGFELDRSVVTAVFEPRQALQGADVTFTLDGIGTTWLSDMEVQFWENSRNNADISGIDVSVVNRDTATGELRVSNAAKPGMRDVYVVSAGDAVLLPRAFEVLEAPPDITQVGVSMGLDVFREVVNETGEVAESVSAFAIFWQPLDPPCGEIPAAAPGPTPFDNPGVFEVPSSPDSAGCPAPKTISAGDFVWLVSDENTITLSKQVVESSHLIQYVALDIEGLDYRFDQDYDLVAPGDPNGLPEFDVKAVQPTIPSDYALLSPIPWGDYPVRRDAPFDYTWTPAETYPRAVLSSAIAGRLQATGGPGFVGSLPWDDGEHALAPAELLQLESGNASFNLSGYVQGPTFGLPFSTIQNNRADSTVSITALVVLQ